jgi:cytochrome c
LRAHLTEELRMNFQPLLSYTLLVTSVIVLSAFQKGDVEKGTKVFESCSVCHDTESEETTVGPSLKAVFEHKKLKSGKTVSDESMSAQINNGGNGMPSFADKLAPDEKQALIAYLHTV